MTTINYSLFLVLLPLILVGGISGSILCTNSGDVEPSLSSTSSSLLMTSDSTHLQNTSHTESSNVSYATNPPEDTLPPDTITNLSVLPDDGRVILTWNNPNDSDFNAIMIRKKTGPPPEDETDGSFVTITTEESFTDYLIENGTTYYYSVFAFDESMNYAAGVGEAATPEDNPPCITILQPMEDQTIIKNQSLVFSASVTQGDPPYDVTWEFLSMSGIPNKTGTDIGSVVFTELGAYLVLVTVQDADGDIEWTTRTIIVNQPATCQDIFNAGLSTGDGMYTIYPPNLGGLDSIDVYCDMTNLGGGWTLLISKHATDGYISPQTLINHSYTPEDFIGSYPTTGNHVYYAYDKVMGTELRMSEPSQPLDDYFTFSAAPITMQGFFDQYCYFHPISFVSEKTTHWMHLCSSFDENADNEAVLFGWVTQENCINDYCARDMTVASLDSKAQELILDSYHHNIGDIDIWIR